MTSTLLYSDVGSPLDLEFSRKGLIYPINDLMFKQKSTFENFLNQLKKITTFEKYETKGLSEFTEIVGDEIFLKSHFDDDMIVVWGKTISFEKTKEIYDVYNECTEDERKNLNIMLFSYFIETNKLMYSTSLLSDEFNPKKYYIPYIDTDEMFKQFFNSSENILLMVGKSGIGKSKLTTLGINWLSENQDDTVNVAIINNPEILALEEFWQSIKNNGMKLVVLDDLDFMLSSRNSDERTNTDVMKNKFLSYFLTNTDGFRKGKIKFFITTNQDFKDIDKAIIRKGRMFDILELRELNVDEAKTIWEKEGLNEYPFTRAITPAELSYEIEKRKNKVFEKDYLKDKSVSHLNKAKKKIGF